MRLHEYSSNCEFVAEFPSVRGISCKCSAKARSKEEAFHQHKSEASDEPHSLESCLISLHTAKDQLYEAYQILRKPAKEIMVGVLSDLERTFNPAHPDIPHAMPFMYYMTGSSLKMNNVRKILTNAASEVFARDLQLLVIAFDGQFLEIAVKDFDGHPMTLCGLDKVVWEKARKTDSKGCSNQTSQPAELVWFSYVGKCSARTFNCRQ